MTSMEKATAENADGVVTARSQSKAPPETRRRSRRTSGPVFEGRLGIVTGASSGLGSLFGESLAARGMSLLLTGRDDVRLQEVADHVRRQGHAGRVETVTADLGRQDGVDELLTVIGERPVEVLINDAGFGTYGPFAEAPVDRDRELIAVNVSAVVQLARAVLPGMLARGSGGILNVASTAAFQPMALQAVYGASKAFVLSFSEALRAETRRSGVHVTALAPGPTRTGFVAGLGAPTAADSRLYGGRLGNPEPVVDAALRALARNRSVAVPGWSNAINIQAGRLLPRNAVTWITARLTGARAKGAPFITSVQSQVLIKGVNLDQTLIIAEQELKKEVFGSVLTLWGIRDQVYTEAQAERVSCLYFQYIDTRKDYFQLWHFAWAISNIYRNGNAAVRAKVELAYQDAKKRAKAAGGFADRHTNGDIVIGDIHPPARHVVQTHVVAPGTPGYLQSLEDYRP